MVTLDTRDFFFSLFFCFFFFLRPFLSNYNNNNNNASVIDLSFSPKYILKVVLYSVVKFFLVLHESHPVQHKPGKSEICKYFVCNIDLYEIELLNVCLPKI